MGNMAVKSDSLELALDHYFKAVEAISADVVTNEMEVDIINSFTHKHRALRVYERMANTYQKLYEKTNEIEYLKKSFDRFKYAIELINFIFDSYELEVSRTQLESETRDIFEGAVSAAHDLYISTSDMSYKSEAFRIVEQSKSPNFTITHSQS